MAAGGRKDHCNGLVARKNTKKERKTKYSKNINRRAANLSAGADFFDFFFVLIIDKTQGLDLFQFSLDVR